MGAESARLRIGTGSSWGRDTAHQTSVGLAYVDTLLRGPFRTDASAAPAMLPLRAVQPHGDPNVSSHLHPRGLVHPRNRQ